MDGHLHYSPRPLRSLSERVNQPAPRGEDTTLPAGPSSMKYLLLPLPLLALLSAACAHVAPYERGSLAKPSMSASDLASSSESHVRAVQEGAIGGGGSAGGGCGCN